MGQEVKNPLRAQSKYGLMGSSAKTGNFFFWGSPEHFFHKNAIWDRTPPPPTHQLQSTCVQEGSRVPNLQMKFNYLNSFKSYGLFSDFVVPVIPTSSLCCPCCPHIVSIAPEGPHVVPMAVVPVVSTPCCPRGPHIVPMVPIIVPIIPTSSPSSPHHPHSLQKVPMCSPWLWSPPHVVPIIPVVPVVAILVRIDRFSRIELFPSNVLSSEKAYYKNDIQ